jgi:hypothetical protein
LEVGDFVFVGLGEDVFDDIGEVEVDFEVLLVQGVHFLYEVFHDKGQVIHEGLFGLILEGGTEVGFVVGIRIDYPQSDQVGVFIAEVINLDFLGNKVVMVVVFDFFTVEIDDFGDDDNFLFHGDPNFAFVELPELNDRYMRVKVRNCLGEREVVRGLVIMGCLGYLCFLCLMKGAWSMGLFVFAISYALFGLALVGF